MPEPTWSTPGEGLRLFLRGATVRASWKVALVVGTILSAANQGGVLLAGDVGWSTWLRVGFNYVVPFCVTSIGFLAARRSPSADAVPPEGHLDGRRPPSAT